MSLYQPFSNMNGLSVEKIQCKNTVKKTGEQNNSVIVKGQTDDSQACPWHK